MRIKNTRLRDAAMIAMTGKPYDMWEVPNTMTQLCCRCGRYYLPISEMGVAGKDYPHYNTGMHGKAGSTWLSHMFNDSYTPEQWEQFLADIFASYFSATKGEAAFYVCIDWRRVADIRRHMEKIMKVSNVIVWDKMVHGLGSDYKYTYELIVVGKKGNPEIQNRFGKEYQDVWHLQRKVGRNDDHATAKPIELCAIPIRHASKQDDIVLDFFGGSGSTLIACEQLNRKCYMMELDPQYVRVIIDRWEKLTGQKAVLQ